MSDVPATTFETTRPLVVVLGFSVALGAGTLVFPLYALDVGLSAALVGVMTSVSAAAQLATRFLLPWMLSLQAERNLIVVATLLIAASAAVLLLSPTVVIFFMAQVLQGSARAIFWTATQSHVIRGSGTAVRRLAQIQMTSKVGTVLGPVAAGALASVSVPMGLWVAVAGAVLAALSALLMVGREPLARSSREARRGVWRRRDVAVGYWASFTSGGWRGIADSYVPVVLSVAGLSAAVVGALLSVAEVAAFMASAWLSAGRAIAARHVLRFAAFCVLLGTGMLPILASNPVAAGLALVAAGFGGGLTTTLGPTIASEHATDGERGTALAAAGAYRSAARMASPSAIAGLGSAVGTSGAMGLAAVLIVAPVLALSGRTTTAPSAPPDPSTA